MTGFLIAIHTIVSLLLIAVVLMQASQGGGLSGTFGGNAASSVLGGQNAGIDTCWLQHPGVILPEGIKPTYQVTELKQLQTILGL